MIQVADDEAGSAVRTATVVPSVPLLYHMMVQALPPHPLSPLPASSRDLLDVDYPSAWPVPQSSVTAVTAVPTLPDLHLMATPHHDHLQSASRTAVVDPQASVPRTSKSDCIFSSRLPNGRTLVTANSPFNDLLLDGAKLFVPTTVWRSGLLSPLSPARTQRSQRCCSMPSWAVVASPQWAAAVLFAASGRR